MQESNLPDVLAPNEEALLEPDTRYLLSTFSRPFFKDFVFRRKHSSYPAFWRVIGILHSLKIFFFHSLFVFFWAVINLCRHSVYPHTNFAIEISMYAKYLWCFHFISVGETGFEPAFTNWPRAPKARALPRLSYSPVGGTGVEPIT